MNRPGTDQVHVLTTVSAEQGIDAILTAASSVSVGKVVPPDGAESLYAARRLSRHLYVRVLLVRGGGQRVSMPATTQGDGGPLQAAHPQGRGGVRKVLLTCGPVSGLVYLGWPGRAGLPLDGRSRVPNATSELSYDRLTVEMEGWIYKALVIPFGDRPTANNSGPPTMRTATAPPSVEESNVAVEEDADEHQYRPQHFLARAKRGNLVKLSRCGGIHEDHPSHLLEILSGKGASVQAADRVPDEHVWPSRAVCLCAEAEALLVSKVKGGNL